MARRARTFRATLEQGSQALGWTIARVPFEPSAVWPKMIRLRVRGEINHFAFRTSLFPDPRGGFYLLVNRAMQKGADAHVGDSAEFRLEPDLDARAPELPDELAVLLDDEPGLRLWYDTLTEYTRREIGKWILGVKTDASRIKRAGQMAERLLSTMEAEVELPPAIALALRRSPKARARWDSMTPLQRRSQLLAVFYYQTPRCAPAPYRQTDHHAHRSCGEALSVRLMFKPELLPPRRRRAPDPYTATDTA